VNFSRFFILRPVFTSMFVLIILLIGSVALSRLSIDLVPDVALPTLTITTPYTGAGPEEIEELISRPIEEAVASAPGVEEITSASREGNSQVRVTFAFGSDLNEASNELRERIDRIINRLPADADRPRLFKFDVASFPIVILGVESDLDPIQTRLLIDSDIKNRLERVPGVASMDALGGLSREIQVDLDFAKILALKIPFDQILKQIDAANLQLPAGSVEQAHQDILVRTSGQFKDLSELENTVVALRQGVPVQLGQIAKIRDTSQKMTSLVRVNGKAGIRLAIRKQAGTNTVEVARKVIAEVEKINQEQQQIQLPVLVDTSSFIKRSLQNVATAVLLGGLLSILILFIFLRNLKTTLVIATAIPVSIIATFILMYFAGFTLNTISLGALALGIGMLVDSAIVVLENIYRNREEGLSAQEAAITGSRQVGSAILSSTLTTVAVFLPLIFVRGVSGVTYQQLAIIVSFSLFCSLVIALTLVPMLTALVLRRGKTRQKITRNASLDQLDRAYRHFLSSALNQRFWILPGVFLLLLATLPLTPLIPVEFMPQADEGEIRVNGEMEPGIRLAVLEKQFHKIEAIVRKEVPEAVHVLTELGATGFGGGDASNKGQLRIYLKPQNQRKRSGLLIATQLRKKLSGIAGAKLRVQPSSAFFVFRLINNTSDARIQVEVKGFDLQSADRLSREVADKIEAVKGAADIRINRDSGSPEAGLIVDRQKAGALGVNIDSLGRALQTAISGSLATTTYREAGKEFRIRVKIAGADRHPVEDLLQLPVSTTQSKLIPLANFVSTERTNGPVMIERKDQERVITVSAEADGRPLAEVQADIQSALKDLNLPRDFSVSLAGDIEEQQKSFRELMIGLVLSLLLVYMILAAQYESFLDPFVVMFSVPLAAIGVILTLFLTKTSFNLQTFIGAIMLGGIVVNNAILLVDQINQLRREEHLPLRKAVEEAGFRRLRPILMTTLTTVLGLLPLAIGLGEGSEAQAPLARTVIGGLSSSTLLTLIIVPLVYYSLEKTREKKPAPAHAEEIQDA